MIRKTINLTVAANTSDSQSAPITGKALVDFVHVVCYWTVTLSASTNIRNQIGSVCVRRAAAFGIAGATKGKIDEDITIGHFTANVYDLSATGNVSNVVSDKTFGPGLAIPVQEGDLLILQIAPSTAAAGTAFAVFGLWLY